MHLDDVTAFFADVEHVNVSIFTVGVDAFQFIHGFVLYETDVNLLKIFTEVLIGNKKNPIVSSK